MRLPDTTLLEPGDRVRDRKRPPDTGTVLAVWDTPANEFHVEAISKTVAEDNPNSPATDSVVGVVWAGLGDDDTHAAARDKYTVYHFPATRLVAEEQVRDVPPDDLLSAPYHCRTFERDANRNGSYIRTIRSQGYFKSLPLARETDAGVELVEGHKRRWVAQEAGLETIAVRLIELDDWAAAVHYAQDHLPSLDAETTQQTVQALAERWGDRIEDIPAIQEIDADYRTITGSGPSQ